MNVKSRWATDHSPSGSLGLSASGKSTLANELEEWIFEGNGHSYILDGDNTRLGINKDLIVLRNRPGRKYKKSGGDLPDHNDAGIIAIASAHFTLSKRPGGG